MRSPKKSSLASRSIILAFARISNYSILVFSPIILTRIFSVDEYGLYREFILYSMVMMGVCQFNIGKSLIYFIPKYPEKEHVFVSQCVVFTVGSYVVGMILFIGAYKYVPALQAFQYATELLLYVFFMVNLDFLENYWLGKRNSLLVFVYGSLRMLSRVGVVVLVAVYTADLNKVIYGLVFVEMVRWAIVLVYLLWHHLLGLKISAKTCTEHIRYFAPLGSSAVIQTLNKYFGQLVTVVLLGPASLALYVLGGYMEIISRVVRGSIADVIFPEMVHAQKVSKDKSVEIWKKSLVVHSFFLIPMSVFVFLNAEVLVVVLFSNDYIGAVPVFMVFSLMLARDCFNSSLPLRVMDRTGIVFNSSIISLSVNLLLTPVLAWMYGIIGPAIALLVSRICEEIYLGWRVMKVSNIRISLLMPWRKLALLIVSSLAAAGLATALVAGISNKVGGAAAFGVVFAITYFTAVHIFHLEEIDSLRAKTFAAIRGRMAGA